MNSRQTCLAAYNTVNMQNDYSFRGRKENVNIQIPSKACAGERSSILAERPITKQQSMPSNNGTLVLTKRKTSFITKAKDAPSEVLCELKLDPNSKTLRRLEPVDAMTDIDRQSANVIKEYGMEIDEYQKVVEKTYLADDCLKAHEITPCLRAKMIDWMVEVLTNFKCNDQTYFMSVSLMDRYLKQKKEKKLIGELHIIGVASMFLGSKYEDILPLRMDLVAEKIAHRKLPIESIKQYEHDILTTLDYFLQSPTILEFMKRYMKGMETVLKEEIGLIEKMSLYLAKMSTHDYYFCNVKPSNIAISSIYVALKICEQLKKRAIITKDIMQQMIIVSGYTEEVIVECAQKILNDAQNFDTLYPGLTNLKKSHFTGLMDYVPK